jgi:hypothetical protein
LIPVRSQFRIDAIKPSLFAGTARLLMAPWSQIAAEYPGKMQGLASERCQYLSCYEISMSPQFEPILGLMIKSEFLFNILFSPDSQLP